MSDNGKIVYTEEELDAMRQVRAKLLEEHGIEESRVGRVFLAICVVNGKLRVDETVKKIVKFLQIMDKLECPNGADDEVWKPEAVSELGSYTPAGQDGRGATIMWIKSGRSVPVENQAIHVQAATMNFIAMHADATSLREGVTMVLDLSSKTGKEKRHGNEGNLQKLYQSYPQRPQAIYIAGTNIITRMLANASIKVAALFSKQKVLDRIQFVTIEKLREVLPANSIPAYLDGKAGGIQNMELWVKKRVEQFPVPDL